jgi:hypothetical protein
MEGVYGHQLPSTHTLHPTNLYTLQCGPITSWWYSIINDVQLMCLHCLRLCCCLQISLICESLGYPSTNCWPKLFSNKTYMTSGLGKSQSKTPLCYDRSKFLRCIFARPPSRPVLCNYIGMTWFNNHKFNYIETPYLLCFLSLLALIRLCSMYGPISPEWHVHLSRIIHYIDPWEEHL